MGLLGRKDTTPRTAKDWVDEGVVLGCRRKQRQALEYFNKGIELSGDDNQLRGTAWIHKGSCHFALREYQEALSSYERSMQIDPANEAVCWQLRAHVLYYWDKRKYYEEAKTCLANASRVEKALYGKADARGTLVSYGGVEVAVDSRKVRDSAILALAISRFQKLAPLELVYGGSAIREL